MKVSAPFGLLNKLQGLGRGNAGKRAKMKRGNDEQVIEFQIDIDKAPIWNTILLPPQSVTKIARAFAHKTGSRTLRADGADQNLPKAGQITNKRFVAAMENTDTEKNSQVCLTAYDPSRIGPEKVKSRFSEEAWPLTMDTDTQMVAALLRNIGEVIGSLKRVFKNPVIQSNIGDSWAVFQPCHAKGKAGRIQTGKTHAKRDIA